MPEGENQTCCPVCGKTFTYRSVSDPDTFPFCSERCRLADLGRWLTEGYSLSEPFETEKDEG